MLKTFLYRINTAPQSFQHIIHSVDIKESVKRWIEYLEDTQGKPYSFDKTYFDSIRHQFLQDGFKYQLEKIPYFFTFKSDDKIQIIYIDEVKKSNPDILATISYLATEEGGRQGYVNSGYRPHIKFKDISHMTSGEQLFLERWKVFPGETITAEIRLLFPDPYLGLLFKGQECEILEGRKVVGQGKILEVTNIQLQRTN